MSFFILLWALSDPNKGFISFKWSLFSHRLKPLFTVGYAEK